MDDPLVPKSVSGCNRLLIQLGCALALIFVFVSALLVFIEGGKTESGGWLVVGTGFLFTMGTTGVLARWIMKNELEDAKHMYLLAAQSLALMILSAGFLAVIYATETPYFYIGGAAGPVILEQSGQRGGVLQIMLDNNQSNVINIGQSTCQSFLFPTKVAKDVRYSVTLKSQPSGSLCTLGGGTGVASKNLLGNDGIRINCAAAWLVGGVVLFTGAPAQWPPGVILANNPPPPAIPELITLQSSSGAWYFPTPILNYTQYSISVSQQPPSVQCTIPDKAVGIATGPISDIQVKCTLMPTPAPPTKAAD